MIQTYVFDSYLDKNWVAIILSYNSYSRSVTEWAIMSYIRRRNISSFFKAVKQALGKSEISDKIVGTDVYGNKYTESLPGKNCVTDLYS